MVLGLRPIFSESWLISISLVPILNPFRKKSFLADSEDVKIDYLFQLLISLSTPTTKIRNTQSLASAYVEELDP